MAKKLTAPSDEAELSKSVIDYCWKGGSPAREDFSVGEFHFLSGGVFLAQRSFLALFQEEKLGCRVYSCYFCKHFFL